MEAYQVIILFLGLISILHVNGQIGAQSMVQIYVGPTLICGGTYYKNDYIITAGNCLSGITANTDLVNIISVVEDAASPDSIRHLVKTIIYPPDSKSDILLLKLETPFETPTAKPITLDGVNIPDFSTLTSLNWEENKIIQGPVATYYPPTRCNPGANTQMCGLYAKSGSCLLAGGPILLNGKQVGIKLYPQNCQQNSYDVFARISSYFKWIQDTSV